MGTEPWVRRASSSPPAWVLGGAVSNAADMLEVLTRSRTVKNRYERRRDKRSQDTKLALPVLPYYMSSVSRLWGSPYLSPGSWMTGYQCGDRYCGGLLQPLRELAPLSDWLSEHASVLGIHESGGRKVQAKLIRISFLSNWSGIARRFCRKNRACSPLSITVMRTVIHKKPSRLM
jgi:hypothetical protein